MCVCISGELNICSRGANEAGEGDGSRYVMDLIWDMLTSGQYAGKPLASVSVGDDTTQARALPNRKIQ